MSNIIFLDIDGVLNHNPWENKHLNDITEVELIIPEKVVLLGELVKKTNAKLILHSGWRFWFDSDMQPVCKEVKVLAKELEKEGLVIADVTPDFSTEEIRKTKRFSKVKAEEILAWLSMHEDVKNWIVLDDLDLHNEIVKTHQIQIDARIGLCLEDIYVAEKMLVR